MIAEITINIFLMMAMLFAAINFLQGTFSGKQNSQFRVIIPFESIFIKNIDSKIVLKADRLCFLICLLSTILTFINTILMLLVKMQNITVIFVASTLIIVWPIRLFFIFYYNKHIEKLPRIWFFKD